MSIHDSESFRNTPRYFTLIVGIIFWPIILKLRCLVISCFLFLKTIISVFPVLRESFFTTNPLTESFDVTVYKFDDFLRDFTNNKWLVSSSKWCTELCMIALCKSLIKSKNNTAPSTDPCGTPYVDISLSELYSLILVYWYLSFKNVSSRIFGLSGPRPPALLSDLQPS